MTISRQDAAALDRSDPLAGFRDRFVLPDGVVYLDGNSLGALPRNVTGHLEKVIGQQWGTDLIGSWNIHDWIDLPGRLGDRIGRLIGAPAGSVTVADSTSINLFKALAAALSLRPDRRVILTEAANFPNDLYIAAGVAGLMDKEVRRARKHELAAALDDEVAVLCLTEVDFRTGERLDMGLLNERAHAVGAVVVWDLSHSTGAVPLDMTGSGADFAVGCGYKFLNGGPGAPAFVYVAPQHQMGLHQPLTGWLGHAAPFEFAPDYRPAPGVTAMRVGTPPILSMAALDAALDVFADADIAAMKAKADQLFELFTGELEGVDGLSLASPRDPARRGSQASFRHPEAYAVMRALIGRGIVGDFREPDILRFGLTPLYTRFVDVWEAARGLREVVEQGLWMGAADGHRAKVV